MAKILLVEDDQTSREMLTMRLELKGHQVVCAVDGAEALEMVTNEQPEIILMDMNLPGIDGWEATRRLKADAAFATIPVIGVSAHAMSGDREKAIAAGCDEYEPKPINLTSLVQKMTQLLTVNS